MKRLLTFLTLLTVFIGVGWATDVTTTFESQTGSGSSLTWSNSDFTFSFTEIPSGATIAKDGNGRGLQMGAGKGTFILESDQSFTNVTKVSIVASTNGTANANSISIAVGSTNFGSQTLQKANNVTYDYEHSAASGNIEITVDDQNKSVYILSVTVTYGSAAQSYTISYGTTTNGSFASGNPTTATAGSTVTIATSPNEGYALSAVTVNPSATVTINGNNASFTMPSSNVTVNATFTALPTYAISVTNGAADATTAYEGQTVTLSPTIPDGKVVDWDNTTVSPSTLVINHSDYTFTMPGEAVTVAFAFKNDPVANAATATFDATVDKGTSPLSKGPVTFACSNGVLNNGTEYRLYANSTTTFSVTEGYKIVKIEFTGTDTDKPLTGLSTTTGNYTATQLSGTWIGEAESVTFTASAQSRATLIKVYYTAPDVTSNIYRVIQTNGEISNAGGWLGNWTNCTVDEEALNSGNANYTVTANAGATVQFKAGTNGGYQILENNVSAVDGDNTAITLTKVSSDDSGITYSFTMPASAVTITANFTTYIPDVYFLSGDLSNWNNGTKMTYSSTDKKYTLRVYFSDEYGYFRFRAGNNSYASGASGGYWPISGLEGESAFGENITLYKGSEKRFRVPAGIYDIEVGQVYTDNWWGETTVKVTKVEPTLTFNPAAGGIASGQAVTVSSNLYDLLHAIDSSIESSAVSNQVKTDGDYAASVTLTADATVTGRAKYGYIEKTATADYTIIATYAINCTAVTDPSDKTGGTVTADKATAAAGEIVTLTIDVNNGYELTSVTVNGTVITATDGVYSFEMPNEAAEVIAYFAAKPLNITVNNDNAKGTVTGVPATSTVGSPISFTVTPNSGYNVSSVTYTFTPANGTPNTQKLTAPYSFNMPGYDVTINVYYTEAYTEKRYQLINSTDEIELDKTYLIVGTNAAGDRYYVMGASGDSRMTAISTTPDSEGVITSTEDMNIITLEASGSNYAIHAEEGYLNNTSTTGNSLSISEIPVYAEITFDTDETVSIQLVDNSTKGLLSFNYANNSQLFRFYGTSQSPTYLYKEIDDNSVKAPTITPKGGTFLNSEYPNGITVTITPVTEGSTIHVTTDGTTYDEYNAATTITVTSTTTVTAYASKGGETSETVSETYTLVDRIIDDVQFSPYPGTYSGAQTLQMYTTTQNAKIYYIISENPISEDPSTTSTTSTLYSETDVINLVVGKTYYVKAIAYVGDTYSKIASGTYTIINGSGLNSINDMNTSTNTSSSQTLNNPVQVVYMNTWRHNGKTPEFAYVRDNTGYGLVYFGNGATECNNYTKFNMGDWLPGNSITSKVDVWAEGFHNEFGSSSHDVSAWPTAALHNSPIIPEETTNAIINAGWNASEYTTGNYASGVTKNNIWGHYVHLRKNEIKNVGGAGGGTEKHYGDIKDQSGVYLNYYDGFYNFSGYNGTDDYDQDFFNGIQNNGGTFDVYAIVAFYGPYADQANHYNTPFEVFPIDFLYIYKPIINIDNVAYSDHDPITEYETKEVTLTCATEGATIWYKTSDMEDYAEYTGPITVDATTTIETYSSIPTKYNDVMESVVNTLIINMGDIPQPVISPASGVFTVGEDEPVDATIEFETDPEDVPDGTVIYFTVDGSDPRDENSARYEYTAENIAQYLTDIEQTTTVRAIAYYEDVARQKNYYSREAEAKTYTFVKSNGIKYDLVTDQTQLNESSVYVIVNKANNMAVGTTQNENNRSADGVKFVDETTKAQVYGNDELAQFTLKKVGNKWYMQTMNGSATGYLYVGDGNTLLTEATATDAAEATITVDADNEHQAHISFVYNNELTRYLRYYNNGKAFSTYTSETSNLPVSLYYIKATPLANIEKEMTAASDKQVTVADQLVAVYMTGDMLWCKDQGNVSIIKTENPDPENIEDYMQVHGGFVDSENKARNWDQSNWVALKFPNATSEQLATIKSYEGKFIDPATVTGFYIDDVNYTIQMNTNTLQVTDGEVYNDNLYCAANFLTANHNGNATGHTTNTTDKHYFFVNPKIQEVCEVTFAMWKVNGENGYFVLPEANGTYNDSRIYGAFEVDWTYNSTGPAESIEATLSNEANQNKVYKFRAIVQRPATSGSQSVPRLKAEDSVFEPMDGVSPDAYYIVYPLDLNPSDEGSIVTRIDNIYDGSREVKSVKYVNVAGIVSDVPFQGVNIVVTEYTDGSRTTTKMLKK